MYEQTDHSFHVAVPGISKSVSAIVVAVLEANNPNQYCNVLSFKSVRALCVHALELTLGILFYLAATVVVGVAVYCSAKGQQRSLFLEEK